MNSTQRAARRIVTGLFSRISTGRLEVHEAGKKPLAFGPGGPPHAVVRVNDPAAWTALLRGSRGMADSYVDGAWDSDDLVAVVRLAARNVQGLDDARRRWAAVRVPYQKLTGVRRRNTVESSRDDIHRHYDMGNDFFELMLDPTMMYSCASFASPADSLREAQIAKLELACEKLDLGPDDHVLEIGTGWGGFAVHAAATRGCRVTTTTISAEQHAYASAQVREAGLEERVTILRDDYRDLRGRYDKLVSLEMIEAVGWRDFPTFFATCSKLLEPDGAMLLQAITMDDRAYEVEKASRSFIRTKIFPNGALPSQQVIARCLKDETDMRMAHHQDLSADYVETLARWRENVERHTSVLEARGYDERFRRLWRMYLCYCEGGFAERRIGVGQSLLVKPGWRGRVASAPRYLLARGGSGTKPLVRST
jgi:cyclopropane-fatty-acyl-phospholipid synthase